MNASSQFELKLTHLQESLLKYFLILTSSDIQLNIYKVSFVAFSLIFSNSISHFITHIYVSTVVFVRKTQYTDKYSKIFTFDSEKRQFTYSSFSCFLCTE